MLDEARQRADVFQRRLDDADVGIAGGRIAALGDGLTGTEVIDAAGKLVLPGGIESHCHIA
ncbi:MAG: hypothetical protein AAFZ09_21190, partial [Pseudomonadota bacterium]